MKLLAIDPGTEKSGIVVWDGERIGRQEIVQNSELLEWLRRDDAGSGPLFTVVCERIECYGMPAGRELFETAYWSGRFMEASNASGMTFYLVPRREVKLHLCGTSRAKDSNVAQALRDRFGDKGTKKSPGVTHGLNSHTWQAFGLAVTCFDNPSLLK